MGGGGDGGAAGLFDGRSVEHRRRAWRAGGAALHQSLKLNDKILHQMWSGERLWGQVSGKVLVMWGGWSGDWLVGWWLLVSKPTQSYQYNIFISTIPG